MHDHTASGALSCLACVALVACLDATPGKVARPGEAPGPAACPRAGAALAFVARETGGFAIGPCGALAYWREPFERALLFLDGAHEAFASYADANGYAGGVRFSPSGRRVAATSLTSDLGTGELLVGDVPLGQTFAPAATLPFGATPQLVFGAGERLYMIDSGGYFGQEARVCPEAGTCIVTREAAQPSAGHIFYLAADEAAGSVLPATPATALFALDLASGDARRVSALDREWRPHGDTQRAREGYLATGDGTRLVLLRECQEVGGAACPSVTVRLLDAANGELVAPLPEARAPKIGEGGLVVAERDQGLVLIAPDGTSDEARGHTLAAVLRDAALTTQGDALYLWRPGSAPRHALDLAGDCVRGVKQRGEVLFYELCSVPNDELHRLDTRSMEDRVLAEGHDFDFDVDAGGAFLAFTYVPLSGTVRELHAGRIDP